MALPTSYLTSSKNCGAILHEMQSAQAPDRFTIKFLEGLGYKSTNDRLIIGVLKSLGFLLDDGKPTQRYFDYLDQTQAEIILAEAIREAYADLFRVRKDAQKLSPDEIKNKFRTLSQGQYSEAVISKMTSTFTTLVKFADFDSIPAQTKQPQITETEEIKHVMPVSEEQSDKIKVDGLVYNIQLVLPESRDQAVYDAIFSSLRKHLR